MTAEPRTLNPMQFFKDAGDAIGVTADYRPRVAKGDPEPEPVSEVVAVPEVDHGEAAQPEPEDDDTTDSGDAATDSGTADEEPSEFDAILTPPAEPEQESKSLDAPVLE